MQSSLYQAHLAQNSMNLTGNCHPVIKLQKRNLSAPTSNFKEILWLPNTAQFESVGEALTTQLMPLKFALKDFSCLFPNFYSNSSIFFRV